MGKTSIEWCDYSWPVITGCTRVSAGCTHCYAEKLTATRLRHLPQYRGLAVMKESGPHWTGEMRLNEKVLADPLRWKKPKRIFVCEMSDLFHEKVPDAWIDKIVLMTMLAKQHVFQILTKRPERMRDYFASNETLSRIVSFGLPGLWLQNVWLGVSVEDQKTADERIPLLLETPAAVRFVSYEPALGLVDFTKIITHYKPPLDDMEVKIHSLKCIVPPHIDWVICGGESGPGARPMHPDWARSARDQCQAAHVPFFFKQWGEWCEDSPENVNVKCQRTCVGKSWPQDAGTQISVIRIGKKAAGRLLDGRDWNEWPEDLRVREFPERKVGV